MSIAIVRQQIIDEIWSGSGFPASTATQVLTNVSNPLSVGATPSNLLRTDRLNFQCRDNSNNLLTVAGAFDGTVYCFVWYPTVPDGRLILWHFGHSTDVNAASNGNQVIKSLVEQGATVVGCIMPGNTADVAEHNQFPARTASLNYLRVFVEGPLRAINHLRSSFTSIYMAGHSGGGWTACLLAAIDTRITRSWHNAGASSLDMTETSRDWEQFLPGLTVDYIDLFLLGSDNGRRQRQSRNYNDTCCFNRSTYHGVGSTPYHWPVKKKAAQLGCDWDLIWSQTGGHEVTSFTRNLILEFFA